MSVVNKLKQLPSQPGVYLYKNKSGETIYIGKAAVLKNRVRQYFQKGRPLDAKTDALVKEIHDIEWMIVDSEIDALFLEAELVRRYLPRYNILLRDDKSTSYVRIDFKSSHPTVTITRRPLDDGAEYFGPYFAAGTVKKALNYLRRAFPYSTHSHAIPKRACLQYHLGLCPGLEENKTSLEDYRSNLRKLTMYLKGRRTALIKDIELDMKTAAKNNNFEDAALLRNQLFALKNLAKQIVFSDKEFLDISKDKGLAGLAELLGLYQQAPQHTHVDGEQGDNEKRKRRTHGTAIESRKQSTQLSTTSLSSAGGSADRQAKTLRLLRRIEGYDISHMSGTDNVASMVVFSNGVPNKTQYRKFKLRLPGNDDFAHMNEAITRRLSPKNIKTWGLPDLILIDGGKGQLSSALQARDNAGQSKIPMIGLAKREEEIIISTNDSATVLSSSNNGFVKLSDNFQIVKLPDSSDVVKLLQRIRDESHRFAVSYHTTLKRERQTKNQLEQIAGIGPVTRKQLLRHFGSMRELSKANLADITSIIGPAKAKIVFKNIKT